MTARLDIIGMVVEDMARSLAFYRRLGLDVPADADTEPHVEATLGRRRHLRRDAPPDHAAAQRGWPFDVHTGPQTLRTVSPGLTVPP